MNDIRNIKFDALVSFLQTNGEKPFRAKQIWTWLWKRGAGSFDEMTDLLWKNLNEQNKISLYIRYIDLKTGAAENRLVNKNK